MKAQIKEQGLSRTEAQLAVNWLSAQGVTVASGWIGVYKLTPSQIAEDYDVELSDLLEAIRR